MYKLKNDIENKLVSVILNDGSGLIKNIPIFNENSDYQEYLKWLDEGNEPLPADLPTD